MNDVQSRKLNMAVATKLVMDNNQAIWSATPAIVSEHALLGNSIVRISTLSILQGTDNKGYGIEKLALKDRLADKAMVVAGPLAGYARINDNQPLLEKVNIVRTDITKAKDADAIDIATLIFTKAEALDPAELATVGITPLMLGGLNTAIVAFTVSVPKPKAAKSNTVAATEAIEEEFNVVDNILKTLDDLHEPFKETAIDYYNTYHIARRIIGTGVRRIHLIVKCLDAISGAVVAGAEVNIAELTVKLDTTRTGNARFFSLPPGSYTVTITHELYQEVMLEHVGIFTGKTTRFDLELATI